MDFGFIRPGSTRREEVLRKLQWADTGIHSEEVFLARWKVSYVVVCGGGPGGGGDCGTIWRARNLIVEFNEQGVVQKARRIGDDDLAKELSTWAESAHEPPLDISRPIQIPVHQRRRFGRLALGQNFFTFQVTHGNAKNIQVPRQQILGFSTLGWKSGSDFIRVEIQYGERPKAEKKLKFLMSPANLVTLAEYLEQSRSNRTSQM